jgi:Jacalin-like lectin domain
MQKPGTQSSATKASSSTPLGTASPEEFGPECGGKGGVPYQVFAKPGERIIRVTIWHREFVDGIELETDQGTLPKIGGTGKSRDIRHDVFEFGPDEYVTGITVEYWNYIDRITFHTNKRTCGPCGGIDGRLQKTLHAPDGRRVVGFKGRHWALVDSIQLMVA